MQKYIDLQKSCLQQWQVFQGYGVDFDGNDPENDFEIWTKPSQLCETVFNKIFSVTGK